MILPCLSFCHAKIKHVYCIKMMLLVYARYALIGDARYALIGDARYALIGA